MLLIYILIVLFVILMGYQSYLANNTSRIIEGLENSDTSTSSSTQEYKPYNLNDPNNSLILAQQNAGNIEVLKGRIDGFDGVKKRVDDMQQSIDSMQTQIDGLVQQQADYAQEIAGSTPPTVTGTDELTSEDVETSIEQGDEEN
jgi:Tfp pilus assembly protein PilO